MPNYSRIHKILRNARLIAEKKVFREKKHKLNNLTIKQINKNQLANTYIETNTEDQLISIQELIESVDCSVRLINCVNNSFLCQMTVAEAILNLDYLETECAKINGMGKKTIRELIEILSHSTDHINQKTQEQKFSYENEKLNIAISNLFNDINLEIICGFFDVPKRVSNGLSNSEFGNLPLGTLFRNWQLTSWKMSHEKNLGQKSVNQITNLCKNLIIKFLKNSNITEKKAQLAAEFILFNTSIDDEIKYDLLEELIRIKNFKISDLANTKIIPPDEIVAQLLSKLNDRDRAIIKRRYGFGQSQAETLDEIGSDYKLTRERIRQIEKRTLAILSKNAKFYPVWESMIEFGNTAWVALSCNKNYITENESKNFKKIPPEFQILFELIKIDVNDWLNAYGTSWQSGWCSKEINLNTLEETANFIIENLKNKSLPRPFIQIGNESLSDLYLATIELKLKRKIYAGYILEKNKLTRLNKRVIELHIIFNNQKNPIEVSELVQILTKRLNNKSISVRYISMLMSIFPHLFIEGDDSNWFGLGHSKQNYKIESIEYTPLEPFENDLDEQSLTVARFLYDIIKQKGPMKFKDIVLEAKKTFPTDRSIASVGPTMLVYKELFSRLLPGVYGLRQEIPDDRQLIINPPNYLLNEEQARLLALGRRAGEPWHAFKLWVPAAEYAICKWAKFNASPLTYESLLTIASVDEWPVTEAEKKQWRELIGNRAGRFHLHFEPRDQVGYAIPKMERFFAACLEAKARGNFNWILGNRILNKQVDSHISAGLIALMNSINVLSYDPVSNWQMPQKPGQYLDELIELLETEMHNFGKLDWNNSIGQHILNRASSYLPSDGGWLNYQRFTKMLENASNRNLDLKEDKSDLTNLLNEFDHANNERLFDNILRELSSYTLGSDEED